VKNIFSLLASAQLFNIRNFLLQIWLIISQIRDKLEYDKYLKSDVMPQTLQKNAVGAGHSSISNR